MFFDACLKIVYGGESILGISEHFDFPKKGMTSWEAPADFPGVTELQKRVRNVDLLTFFQTGMSRERCSKGEVLASDLKYTAWHRM